MGRAANILWLGLKELRSLASDPVLVAFILYAFTLAIISQARGVKSEVNNASLAFIDEDQSQLSKELIAAFFPPRFQHPQIIAALKTPLPRWTAVNTCSSSPYRPGSSSTFVVAGPPRSRSMSTQRPCSRQASVRATSRTC